MYVGMLMLALVPRILVLLVTNPPFDSLYWMLAGSLLHDRSLSFDGVATTAFEPGYPAFLALSRAALGDRAMLVQIFQCVVAAAGAVFLFRLSRTLTNRWQVGLIAVGLYSTYPLLLRHAADPTDAALITTLLLVFVSELAATATPARAAAAGFWLGLAVLTRAMVLPLGLLGAAILWRTQGGRAPAAFVLMVLVVVTPFAIRNYALNGAVLPTRSGVNLFISNSRYTPQIFPSYGPDVLGAYAGSVYSDQLAIVEPMSPVVERQEDLVFTRKALAEIRHYPVEILGLKFRNVLYFFSPRLVPYHEPTPATRIQLGSDGRFVIENSPPRRMWHQVVYTITYTPVLFLALAGVWLRRHALSRDAILWSAVLTFVVVHAVYFPTTRYRVPVEFVLLFYAAVTLDHWLWKHADDAATPV
jgi:hypothetical protein